MSKTTRTINRWLVTRPWQDFILSRVLESQRRIHNALVKYIQPKLDSMMADSRYPKVMGAYIEAAQALGETPGDEEFEKLRKACGREMNALMKEYGVREQDLQKFANDLRKRSYQGQLNSDIVQKEATRVYAGVKKCVWGNGKHLSYKKVGQLASFEEKKGDTGIIYRPATDIVTILGDDYELVPVKKGDAYLAREMEAIRDGRSKVAYGRVKAVPVGKKIRYQLQLVVEGESVQPALEALDDGRLFIDTGMSIMAGYGGDEAFFFVLAEDVCKYNEEIASCARRYDLLRRRANPDNYNEDGTVRRDTRAFKKRWNHTPEMKEALVVLKDAYRRRTEYVERSHAETANMLACCYSEVLVEKIDYAAAMKKAKKLPDVNDETARIVDSIAEDVSGNAELEKVLDELNEAADKVEGTTPGLSKNKARKLRRFGRSINMRAPALFLSILKEKVEKRGGVYIEVPCRLFALSQLNHATGEKVKAKLSERTKVIMADGEEHRVQRDLYSAFLGYHIVLVDGKPDHIDLKACKDDFDNFLKCQAAVVAKMHETGDVTGNFGLSDFR